MISIKHARTHTHTVHYTRWSKKALILRASSGVSTNNQTVEQCTHTMHPSVLLTLHPCQLCYQHYIYICGCDHGACCSFCAAHLSTCHHWFVIWFLFSLCANPKTKLISQSSLTGEVEPCKLPGALYTLVQWAYIDTCLNPEFGYICTYVHEDVIFVAKVSHVTNCIYTQDSSHDQHLPEQLVRTCTSWLKHA